MPTKEQLRQRLIDKLEELFQLNQPDLDFGFYRIMHAKAQEVQSFIKQDLMKIIDQAFGEVNQSKVTELEQVLANAVKTAQDFGAPDPMATEPVKKAKAELDAAKSSSHHEADIYDHLYRFFERYYDDGDFISRRYYTRETSGKAAPYAVPYHGEEVKLIWANSDQYYIKTAEYFNNFTFDLIQSAEVRNLGPEEKELQQIPDNALKVHFQLTDIDEGEHGNIKAGDDKKRQFILDVNNPVMSNESNEMVVNFQYKVLPDGYPFDSDEEKELKSLYKAKNKGDIPILWMSQRIIAAVKEIPELADYVDLLQFAAPTETIAARPLIAKYLNQYTARNSSDYFIHKNLGGFLKRELDFYIKNEVMRLDDIENADAPNVESYLTKIKVMRKIAHHLIQFLAQLEDFQKKLWLKKKFVVETNYCITIDSIPENLHPEIIANSEQREAWIKLFAIDEVESYSNPLTQDFLKSNPFLVLDTQFFDASFKAQLLATIDNFDEQCNGLLVHSENFQALHLLQERYREQVNCIYIDPPYNTSSTPIIYKNSYKHSSWASLMWDRLTLASSYLNNEGIKSIAIDDAEMVNLSKILETIYSEYRLSKVTVVHNPKGSITKAFNRVHEYALFLTKEDSTSTITRTLEENDTPRKMRRWGENSLRTERRLSFYPIYVKDGDIIDIGSVPDDDFHPTGRNVDLDDGTIEIWPIDQNGIERRWNFGLDSIRENLHRITVIEKSGVLDLFLTHELTVPKTVWKGGEYDAGKYGNSLLIDMIGKKIFDFPKSINLVKKCVTLSVNEDRQNIVLDYFGGSGTTAHAVIELNRTKHNQDIYVLSEMGEHFDTVLKPRVQKAIYSKEWKNGKPVSRDSGISQCFKYIRLESYEDTLNNLRFEQAEARHEVLSQNSDLRTDYMLNYMLDVETKGSQSLLNIDAFADPEAYALKVKQPNSDEHTIRQVDLLETFNYLLGLRVNLISAPQYFNAEFTRLKDEEVPEEQLTKLVLQGSIKKDEQGPWWFRKIEGWLPKNTHSPNNGEQEKVLIVWRKLTGDLEKDNLMLDEWFKKHRISTRDFEFDTVYVNGSNNLPNLKLSNENWKVRLIEEEFMKKMWDVEVI